LKSEGDDAKGQVSDLMQKLQGKLQKMSDDAVDE
jgi:hypothetical protein